MTRTKRNRARRGGSETTTKLAQAAYNAQFGAGLPLSELAQAVFGGDAAVIDHRQCATYIHAVQRTDWFTAAFAAHAVPATVVGGGGRSHADAAERRVKIGTYDRVSPTTCEQACLHELAHLVTSDYGSDLELREPVGGRESSKGHHHAWRANFVFIVRMTLGRQAATRLRNEFNHWGLPTRG